MGERVVTCMSGGVDSSVAAARLLDAGHEVIGVFMRSGASQHPSGEQQGCCSVEDSVDARRVADRLGIPFYALNMEEEFGRIMDRFAADYARGRTPNPCVLCNRWLKFGHVLRFARDVGATRIASGHYARVERVGERWTLSRPVDRRKDQSYVLAVLEQDPLAALELPLGGLTKDEVRDEAARRGFFRVAGKQDSQEICFVQSDYRAFLRERLPADVDALQPGAIVDTEGRELGRHAGTAGFTVGQRKGIGVAATHPLYVQRTDPARRLVVVGPRSGLGCAGLEAEEVTWLGTHLATGESCAGRAQVRAHGATYPGTLTALDGGRVAFAFEAPVEAVVSGQALVVYDPDDRYVLASAWIDQVRSSA
ncbi:MAG: tRNA 2-thiouridine(34) synthase MnmA [Planctomycetes bacterium]|nr:tRNA 2-thiouridine(34) synthase MnmA [Planctomycetota bacterium]